jgi:hypothetical protein
MKKINSFFEMRHYNLQVAALRVDIKVKTCALNQKKQTKYYEKKANKKLCTR